MNEVTVVGVRQLRTHLSAYLRAVAHGETVTIGDRRGRPVARLVPIERDPVMGHFEQLAREGRATLPTGRKPGRFGGVTPRPGARLVSDLVIEGRR